MTCGANGGTVRYHNDTNAQTNPIRIATAATSRINTPNHPRSRTVSLASLAAETTLTVKATHIPREPGGNAHGVWEPL